MTMPVVVARPSTSTTVEDKFNCGITGLREISMTMPVVVTHPSTSTVDEYIEAMKKF